MEINNYKETEIFKQLIKALEIGDDVLFHVQSMTNYQNKLLNSATIYEIKEICNKLIVDAARAIEFRKGWGQATYPYSKESAELIVTNTWSNIANLAAELKLYKINKDKQFTLQEFEKQDVCFKVSDELISDDFDDIWEWIYNDTDYLQELSEKEILDKYSHVKLYKKEFAKCPAEIVDDYLNDNFYIESAALKSIPELVAVRTQIQNFNETQNWYIQGACVGWIDLSEIIKEYMKDEVK